jgi:hypothetical protein
MIAATSPDHVGDAADATLAPASRTADRANMLYIKAIVDTPVRVLGVAVRAQHTWYVPITAVAPLDEPKDRNV